MYSTVLLIPVVAALFIYMPLVLTDNQQSCAPFGTSLVCEHHIPKQIPNGCYEIYIKDYASVTITRDVFADSSWQFVVRLDIIVHFKINLDIQNYAFYYLKKLSILGIHAPRWRKTREHLFAGLDKLDILDLSQCSGLDSVDIMPALTLDSVDIIPALTLDSVDIIPALTLDSVDSVDSVDTTPALTRSETLPNLSTLVLRGLQTLQSEKCFRFDTRFLEMLWKMAIKNLILSGTCIIMYEFNTFQHTLSLESLDMSNSTITFFPDFNRDSIARVFKNVKQGNISSSPPRFIGFNKGDSTYKYLTEDCSRPFNRWARDIEQLFVNDDINVPSALNSIYIDLSQCNYINWKTLHLRGNNINKLNVTVHWPKNISLQELDLSSNEMFYLAQRALSGLYELQKLFLANNRLSQMEEKEDFAYLFRTFSQLLHLNLANNGLIRIPYLMFANNSKLRILNLMDNNLDSVSFMLNHLVVLETMDLQGNKIMYLEGTNLFELQKLFHNIAANGSFFNISFDENPLECSCKSLDFISWVVNVLQPVINRTYQCILDGDLNKGIDLSLHAVDESEYLCYRTVIIVTVSISTCIALVVLVVLSVIGINSHRKREQKLTLRKFIEDLKKDALLHERKLVFLSHSSQDKCSDYVYANFEATMKEILGVERDIVSLGDIDFTPGLPVFDEMIRCISAAYVVVFVISRAFCESDWCRSEVREAYQRQKPIILILIEHVDVDVMPPVMRTVFDTRTRVKLIQKDRNQYELIPGWQRVCESVLMLAWREATEGDKEGNGVIKLGMHT